MRDADNANDDQNPPPGSIPLIGKFGHVPGMPLTAESPIEALGVTVRTYNSLARAGLRRVGDVAALSDEQLLALRHFSTECLADLRRCMRHVKR